MNTPIRRLLFPDKSEPRYICINCKTMHIERCFEDRSLYCLDCGSFDYMEDVKEVFLQEASV